MNFDEFIERETEQKNADPSHLREKRLQEWRRRVAELYDMVKDIMSEYAQSGKVSITTDDDLDLYEELLGHYKVPQMKITLGSLGKYVTLDPVGAYVIGAWGRVDMRGPNGATVRLVLVDSHLKSPRFRVTDKVVDEPVPQKSNPLPAQAQTEPDPAWRLATLPPKIEYIPITKTTFLEAVMNLFGYE